MRSPSCAKIVENALRGCARVGSAQVSYLFGEAIVHGPASIDELQQALRPLGYSLDPSGSMRAIDRRSLAGGLALAFAVSGFCIIAVLMGRYIPVAVGIFVALLQIGLAWPLWREAIEELSQRMVGPSLAPATGLLLLLIAALGQLLTRDGGALLSSFIQAVPLAWLAARIVGRSATHWREHLRSGSRPRRSGSVAIRKDTAVAVAADEITVGEELIVAAGDPFPADGRITHGVTEVDLSSLTGNVKPKKITRGDIVPAGALNLQSSVVIQVLAPSHVSAVRRLEARWESAQLTAEAIWKPELWMDLMTKVGILSGVTALVVGLGSWEGLCAVATVCLGFCPLLASRGALSLLAALSSARQKGMHFRSAFELLQTGKIDELIFHKRGALTLDQPRVTDVVNLSNYPEAVLLSLIASVEHEVEHPLGEAIDRFAEEKGYSISRPVSVKRMKGRGAGAQVERASVVVGSANLVRSLVGPVDQWKPQVETLEKEGKTVVYAAVSRKLAALVAARDTLRPTAKSAINSLRRLGIEPKLVSGDAEPTVRHFAEAAGVRSWAAGLGPEERAAHVVSEKRTGRRVGVVGTGPGDSSALARADVSLLIRKLPALEPREESVVLPDADLERVATAIRHSRRAARAKLAWALVAIAYSPAVAIAACLGWLPPPAAAVLTITVSGALSFLPLIAEKGSRESDGGNA